MLSITPYRTGDEVALAEWIISACFEAGREDWGAPEGERELQSVVAVMPESDDGATVANR